MTTWDLSKTKHHVLICNGGSCMKSGGEDVTQAIRSELNRVKVDDTIHTTRTRCNGRCDDSCVVIVYPEGIWYNNVTPQDAASIVEQHLLGGKPVERLTTYRYVDQAFQRTENATTGLLKSEFGKKNM